MDINRDELSRIKEVLKSNPRGMNVLEISRAINMHRQSVAKYLEMLVIAGHVDVKAFGPSKVYYLSQRLPISAMLSLSSNFILVVDKDLRIINVNDRFLEFTNTKRDEILYKSLEHFSFPIEFEPPIMPNVTDALKGKESSIEAYFKKRGSEQFFNIKFIPLVFDDGQPGATILFEEVTDRRLIEMAIRESEQKLRSVIEQSLDGIIITDEHGLIIEYNRGQEQITGIAKDDALGKYLWDIEFSIEPEEKRDATAHKKIRKMSLDLLKSDQSKYGNRYYEVQVQRPDGAFRKLQVIKTPIQTEKGFLVCSISRDITDREQMNNALSESEEKFQVLTETVSAGVAIYQGENFIEVNKAFERITGYSREELLSMKFWDIIHDDYKSLVKERGLSRQRGQPEPAQYEIKLLRKDGSIKYVESNAGYIVYKGRPGGVITYFDITERKKAEAELHDSEEKFRQIADNVNLIYFLISPDCTRLFYVNPAYERVMGLRTEDLYNDPLLWQKLLPPEDRQAVLSVIEKLGRGEFPGPGGVELRFQRPDGTQGWVIFKFFPVKDEAGKLQRIVGIVEDITERKRNEEDREALIRQLKESNEQLSMILHVTDSSATTLSLDEVLNSTLNRLLRDMNADICAILLKDNERVYVQAAQADKLAQFRAAFPIGNHFESTIFGTVKPLYLEDVRQISGPVNPVLKEIGVRTVLGIPMRHRNDTIGVLFVEWIALHPFKQQEQDVLQIIADRCGASVMMQTYMKRPKNFIEKTYINRSKYF